MCSRASYRCTTHFCNVAQSFRTEQSWCNPSESADQWSSPFSMLPYSRNYRSHFSFAAFQSPSSDENPCIIGLVTGSIGGNTLMHGCNDVDPADYRSRQQKSHSGELHILLFTENRRPCWWNEMKHAVNSYSVHYLWLSPVRFRYFENVVPDYGPLHLFKQSTKMLHLDHNKKDRAAEQKKTERTRPKNLTSRTIVFRLIRQNSISCLQNVLFTFSLPMRVLCRCRSVPAWKFIKRWYGQTCQLEGSILNESLVPLWWNT